MVVFCFSLFSYVTLLLLLLKLPEKIWDYLLDFHVKWQKAFKIPKSNWPFIGGLEKGKELLLSFSECEERLFTGNKIPPRSLPQYKFYTQLLEQLLVNHRTLGIGIKKFLPEIRAGLIRDLQFEKKIFNEIVGAFLQFLVISLTTWCFVYLSSAMILIPTEKSLILIMISLQLSGVGFFFFLIKKAKSKIFTKFSEAIKELYLFTSFLEIGLSLNEIITRSGILEGNLVHFKVFAQLAERVKKLITRLRETGLPPRDESQEIICQIWHLQEESFHKFTKIVQVLKFIVLVFFFLPAYFLYLTSIFKFFMEQ